jgi:exosome complex component RRP42
VYIDALILNYNGNLLDAIMIATRAALGNTKIGKCSVEEASGKFEFDISDEETESLQGWRDVPISVTVCKIGSRFVLDATPMEDMSADVRLMVSVNRQGKVCSVQKDGYGFLEPFLLTEMIQTAQKAGSKIISGLDSILVNEEARLDEAWTGHNFSGFLV